MLMVIYTLQQTQQSQTEAHSNNSLQLVRYSASVHEVEFYTSTLVYFSILIINLKSDILCSARKVYPVQPQ